MDIGSFEDVRPLPCLVPPGNLNLWCVTVAYEHGLVYSLVHEHGFMATWCFFCFELRSFHANFVIRVTGTISQASYHKEAPFVSVSEVGCLVTFRCDSVPSTLLLCGAWSGVQRSARRLFVCRTLTHRITVHSFLPYSILEQPSGSFSSMKRLAVRDCT